MSIKLNQTVAEITYDNLFYANDPAANTDGAIIASGQGKLARGTALAKVGDDTFVILGTTKAAGYYEATDKDAGALKVIQETAAGYVKVTSTDHGAIEVVTSEASDGEILLAGVTPVVGSYTPQVGDFVLWQDAIVATGGEISLADVTPVIGTYTPEAGDYVLYQKADVYEADCILTDAIDATSAAANAVVYHTGHFNEDALKVKSGYTLTDADKAAFRAKGILLSTAN